MENIVPNVIEVKIVFFIILFDTYIIKILPNIIVNNPMVHAGYAGSAGGTDRICGFHDSHRGIEGRDHLRLPSAPAGLEGRAVLPAGERHPRAFYPAVHHPHIHLAETDGPVPPHGGETGAEVDGKERPDSEI